MSLGLSLPQVIIREQNPGSCCIPGTKNQIKIYDGESWRLINVPHGICTPTPPLALKLVPASARALANGSREIDMAKSRPPTEADVPMVKA